MPTSDDTPTPTAAIKQKVQRNNTITNVERHNSFLLYIMLVLLLILLLFVQFLMTTRDILSDRIGALHLPLAHAGGVKICAGGSKICDLACSPARAAGLSPASGWGW